MRCISPFTIMVAVIILLSAICTPVSAGNSQQILAELRRSDDALRQGSLTYDETLTTPEEGTVRYQMYYSADGRGHLIPKTLKGKLHAMEAVFDKDCGFLVSHNNKDTEIIFSNDANPIASKENIMWNVIPAPCFALGRGLTSLENITLNATGTHLEGVAPDGTKIEALLDPNHGYVAREIIRKSREADGHVLTRWLLDGSRDFGDGVFIATRSTYEVQKSNTVQTQKQIVVLQAQFKSPSHGLLTYDWHRPGLRITDWRLGSTGTTGGFFKSANLPPDITPSQLLEMTRKQGEEQVRLREVANKFEKAREQQSTARSRILFAGALILVAMGIIGIVIIKRNLRSKGV